MFAVLLGLSKEGFNPMFNLVFSIGHHTKSMDTFIHFSQ